MPVWFFLMGAAGKGLNLANKNIRLLCVIPHAPAFDSCFPLLERLHQRRIVEPIILLGRRLQKTEPNVIAAFSKSNLPFVSASLFRLEIQSVFDVSRANAVLTHSDPLAYGDGKFRPRDKAILRLRKPTIFVQHGIFQNGLHSAGNKSAWAFHSDLLLLWAPLIDSAPDFISPSIENKIKVTGLIKQNRRGGSSISLEKVEAALGNWKRKVLICHNFGFEPMRYSNELAAFSFAEWAKVAKYEPETLFIVRSHRGRFHPEMQNLQRKLTESSGNIILSERHSGLMRMATIYELLSLVDRVITHPSTVILDSLYEGVPVAIHGGSRWSGIDCLPVAETSEQIISFLNHNDPLPFAEPIFRTYGDITTNLDIAAETVETFLQGL